VISHWGDAKSTRRPPARDRHPSRMRRRDYALMQPPPVRISIVIPHFNGPELLAETIASIREREDVEIVVVDDGSTVPGVAKRLADLAAEGARVERQPHAGPAAAMNHGVAAASGRYVLILGADDLLEPRIAGVFADALDDDLSLDFVYGDYEFFGAKTGMMRSYEWEPWRAIYASCWPGIFMIRKDTFLRVGGYADGTPFEDWDLYMKLAEQDRRGTRIPGVSFRYRFSDAGRGQANRHHLRHETRRLRRAHPRLVARRRELQREVGTSFLLRLGYPVAYWLRRWLPVRFADALFDALAALRRRVPTLG
jgi:glycosyltransferase involved in cell wall biosynthesis